MAHIWARLQVFDQLFTIPTVQPVDSTIQRLTLSAASIFVAEGLFMSIYFLLFEENHENRISRAREKISLTISLFFRKMTV